MNLLFDTNIIFHIAKNLPYHRIEEITNAENLEVFISVATIAELRSLSLQNNWGTKKVQRISEIMVETTVVEITENLVNTHA
jgi:tRNA(fMet)-specific endonuclease VapC